MHSLSPVSNYVSKIKDYESKIDIPPIVTKSTEIEITWLKSSWLKSLIYYFQVSTSSLILAKESLKYLLPDQTEHSTCAPRTKYASLKGKSLFVFSIDERERESVIIFPIIIHANIKLWRNREHLIMIHEH